MSYWKREVGLPALLLPCVNAAEGDVWQGTILTVRPGEQYGMFRINVIGRQHL